MKSKTLFFLLLFFTSCSLFSNEANKNQNDIVLKDSTLIISSIVTISEDYHFSNPEVILARAINNGYQLELERDLKGSFWEITRGQLLALATMTRVDIAPERDAYIELKNITQGTSIRLPQIELGVYTNNEVVFSANPNDSLTLAIELQDGNKYFASTIVPKFVEWTMPDTVTTRLRLITFNTNPVTYGEESIADEENVDIDSPNSRIQRIRNMTHDRVIECFTNYSNDVLYLDDVELDTLPNNFLRKGKEYSFFTYDYYPNQDYFWGTYWLHTSDKPFIESLTTYMTVSQLDSVFSKFYDNYRVWLFSKPDAWVNDPVYLKNDSLNHSKLVKDNSYIYRISNIYKADSNGNPLFDVPKDAVGIFGSRASVYRKTVLKPIRSWDPDTLNWAR